MEELKVHVRLRNEEAGFQLTILGAKIESKEGAILIHNRRGSVVAAFPLESLMGVWFEENRETDAAAARNLEA